MLIELKAIRMQARSYAEYEGVFDDSPEITIRNMNAAFNDIDRKITALIHQLEKEQYGTYFAQTSEECPEQYDVFVKDKMERPTQIGYVRLRWGNLRAYFPDIGGRLVYESGIGEGGATGRFTNATEREIHLNKISRILLEAFQNEFNTRKFNIKGE